MKKVKMSKHLTEDRIDRAVFIGTTIGFGEIIAEFIVEREGRKRRHCITDTGVVMIKPVDEDMVITVYIASVSHIMFLYGGKEAVPPTLWNKVCRNGKLKLNQKSIHFI